MMEEGRLLLSALVPDGKDWVDVFAALATPIIAALAAMFAYRGYRLERRKREDELFDRRQKFYMRLREYYLLNCDQIYVMQQNNEALDMENTTFEIVSLASESRFLFGEEFAQNIKNIPKRKPPEWIHQVSDEWRRPPRLQKQNEGAFTSEIEREARRIHIERIMCNKRQRELARRAHYPLPDWFDEPFLKYMAFEK